MGESASQTNENRPIPETVIVEFGSIKEYWRTVVWGENPGSICVDPPFSQIDEAVFNSSKYRPRSIELPMDEIIDEELFELTPRELVEGAGESPSKKGIFGKSTGRSSKNASSENPRWRYWCRRLLMSSTVSQNITRYRSRLSVNSTLPFDSIDLRFYSGLKSQVDQVRTTMPSDNDYQITGIDLSDDQYTVEQSLIRNKYEAVDAAGNTVLRGKQKLFKMKEEFPFSDGDGNDVFTVKAGGILDIAGDYLLVDSHTGEEAIILDNDFSIFRDTWRVRDADDRSVLAEINSRGALVTLARNYLPFGEWIPHKYEITDPNGNHVGSIHGQFSFRDRYEITIDDASDVPKEPIVVSAMVIDAIQGN